MIRIDYLLLGYVTFKIAPGDVAALASKLSRAGLSCRISSDGRFNVRYSKKTRFIELLSNIEYSVSEPKGLFGALLGLKRRYGLIAAILLSFFLLLISRTVVWDIRIDGVDGEDRKRLISELSESGLSVGSLWHKIDTSAVEAKALLSSETVAWLNVNRRGTVAYVTAVPKRVSDDSDNKTGAYCNVVASRDCVIEKITVKRGVALVKVGETVRAGDVLISGVIPTELGGGVCYAEGSVIGRFSDKVSSFSASVSTRKVYSEPKIQNITLKLFKKEINIFKRYGNLEDTCDIIEKKRQLTLFSKAIPITLTVTECVEYTEEKFSLDNGELARITGEKLSLLIAEKTESMTLISIKTDGSFKDGGYLMSADVIASGEVAKVKEFYRE